MTDNHLIVQPNGVLIKTSFETPYHNGHEDYVQSLSNFDNILMIISFNSNVHFWIYS